MPLFGSGGGRLKLRSIQVLRALAAIGVVIHHAYSAVNPHSVAQLGAAGVDLFFVISGFIMATIGPRRSPGSFLFDRAWRIFPLWWIALIPWLIVRQPDMQELLSSLALWPIYGGAFHSPVLAVGWTLCFEILFYAAFAMALATRIWVPLLGFALCLAASNSGSALFHYLGSPLILEFLAGVVIARLPRLQALGLPLLVIGLAAFASSPLDYANEAFGEMAWLRVFHWGLPAAITVYAALSLERHFTHRLFEAPVFLGNASYSIYLFHQLIAANGNWILGTALSILIGSVSYLLVERPIMAFRARLRRRRSRVAADLSPEPAG